MWVNQNKTIYKCFTKKKNSAYIIGLLPIVRTIIDYKRIGVGTWKSEFS